MKKVYAAILLSSNIRQGANMLLPLRDKVSMGTCLE